MKYKQYIKPLNSYDKGYDRVSSPINITIGGVKTSKRIDTDKKNLRNSSTFLVTSSSKKPKSGKKSSGHTRKPTKDINNKVRLIFWFNNCDILYNVSNLINNLG
jgi:hypothetical protein